MLSKLLTTKEQVLLAGCAAAICIGGIAYYFAHPAPQDTTVSPVALKEIVVPSPVETPTATLEPSVDEEPENISPAPSPQKLRVFVAGAVESPGLYEFDPGDRVSDAVRAAGGVLEFADVSDINQAATLVDGSTLAIPRAGQAGIADGKRLVLRAGESAAALNPAEYTISGWRGRKSRSVSSSSDPAAPIESTAPATTTDGPLDLNTATVEQLETLPGVGPKTATAIIEYRQRQPFKSIDDLDNVPGIGEKKLEDLRPHVRVGG